MATLSVINEKGVEEDLIPIPSPLSRVSAAGRSCKYCPGAVFDDQDEFRAHYQSPWHVHNQNLSLRSRPTIPFDLFQAIQSIQEEASDSDDDYEEEEESEADDESSDEEVEKVDPMVRFSCSHRQYSLCRSLLFQSKQEYRETPVSEALLRSFLLEASMATWALFLIKSGRVFAGIYDHSSGQFVNKRSFKRYTERRKQGGSQLLRDKSGKVAKSAGSQLRRQNEQALLKDVEDLVKEWESELSKCQVILWNKTLFGQLALFPANGSVLTKYKPLLRTFPFSTYKPSAEEALRCISKFCTLDKA